MSDFRCQTTDDREQMTEVSILLGKIFVKKYGVVNSTLIVKMLRKSPLTPLYERGEPDPPPFSNSSCPTFSAGYRWIPRFLAVIHGYKIRISKHEIRNKSQNSMLQIQNSHRTGIRPAFIWAVRHRPVPASKRKYVEQDKTLAWIISPVSVWVIFLFEFRVCFGFRISNLSIQVKLGYWLIPPCVQPDLWVRISFSKGGPRGIFLFN